MSAYRGAPPGPALPRARPSPRPLDVVWQRAFVLLAVIAAACFGQSFDLISFEVGCGIFSVCVPFVFVSAWFHRRSA